MTPCLSTKDESPALSALSFAELIELAGLIAVNLIPADTIRKIVHSDGATQRSSARTCVALTVRLFSM